ncbi:MAG: hypothetical protein HXL33_04505 [Prevotellaceae bacterium]|jgi:hypothetical protein|nr:hypothetical protein [Prevotellaceae bacterium]MBF1074636.1 hypothetical protein [Prevotellaceae bacterium]
MKQLSKLQSIVFLLGGALMVVGVGSFVLLFYQSVSCWVFLAGAILFATVQLMQTFEGDNITIKRLKRIQDLSDILFIIAGIILVDTVYGFFRDFFSNYENYVTYLYNKWVIVLFLATLLELYTVHRIDYELSKKNIKA